MRQKTELFNRKIFSVLKVLSRNEVNEFGRFIGQTAFNCDDSVVRLFNFLKKYHPDYDHLRIKEAKVIKAVFDDPSKVSGRLLDKKVSALIHLVEKYLLIKELDNPSQEKKLILANIYNQRHANKLFLRLMEKIQKEVKRKTVPNTWDYYAMTKAHFESYFHPSRGQLDKSIAGDQLKETIESHKDYFVAGMLRLAVEGLTRQMSLGEKINIPLLKEVRELAANMKNYNPLVNIYSLILFHAEHADDTSFNMAEELFRNYHENISKAEQNMIITMLINFSLILFTKERKAYQLRAFKLYQLAFEKDWLEYEGKISADHFSRAVFMGVDLGFWSWVEETLENFPSKLDPANRENTLLISKAYLSFAYEKFEEVLHYLRQANFPNIFFDLNSRSLIVKSYYELNQKGRDYPIIDYCESYRQYLLRKKNIPSIFVERNLNFLKIVKRMANSAAEEKEALVRELQYKTESMPLISKKWIIEKINQLS